MDLKLHANADDDMRPVREHYVEVGDPRDRHREPEADEPEITQPDDFRALVPSRHCCRQDSLRGATTTGSQRPPVR
jgi:hypothetical protein